MIERLRYMFFFFKQKTAYEIGTGDWSSDVCSSDLLSVIDLQPILFGGDLTGNDLICPTCQGFDHHGSEIGRASCRERV